jgi:hypothetical protein
MKSTALVAVIGLALVIAVAAGFSSVGETSRSDLAGPPDVEKCGDSVYQTPASEPPRTYAALRLGPIVINRLAPVTLMDVQPPRQSVPFYVTKNPLNVLASARRGVIVSLIGRKRDVAIVYLPYERYITWFKRFRQGRAGLSDLPRVIKFFTCRDPVTRAPLNTQYVGGFLFETPGCVTLEVRAMGAVKRHRATIPFLVPHC